MKLNVVSRFFYLFDMRFRIPLPAYLLIHKYKCRIEKWVNIKTTRLGLFRAKFQCSQLLVIVLCVFFSASKWCRAIFSLSFCRFFSPLAMLLLISLYQLFRRICFLSVYLSLLFIYCSAIQWVKWRCFFLFFSFCAMFIAYTISLALFNLFNMISFITYGRCTCALHITMPQYIHQNGTDRERERESKRDLNKRAANSVPLVNCTFYTCVSVFCCFHIYRQLKFIYYTSSCRSLANFDIDEKRQQHQQQQQAQRRCRFFLLRNNSISWKVYQVQYRYVCLDLIRSLSVFVCISFSLYFVHSFRLLHLQATSRPLCDTLFTILNNLGRIYDCIGIINLTLS